MLTSVINSKKHSISNLRKEPDLLLYFLENLTVYSFMPIFSLKFIIKRLLVNDCQFYHKCIISGPNTKFKLVYFFTF